MPQAEAVKPRRSASGRGGPLFASVRIVTNRFKAMFCVGLVVLGLVLTIPWLALIGWLAVRLVGIL